MRADHKIYTKREPWSTGYWAYIEGSDDMGPDNITGWGATEADAIEDLLEQIDEDKCPMCHADLVPDYNYCRSCAEVVR